MTNINLILTLEAFNQKHGEFYLQLQSLAKQYGITISNGATTPTASAPTSAPKKAETPKKDYTAHLTLTLDDNGYIRLPIRHKFTMIKAAKMLADKGCVRTDDYGYYIPNNDKKATINKKATKELFDSFENHELIVK